VNFFGGFTHGLQSGLQLISDWIRLMIWAVEGGKADCITDCMGVAKQFGREIADETGAVTSQIVATIIGALIGGGHDPFAGSRHLMQQATIKWGKH